MSQRQSASGSLYRLTLSDSTHKATPTARVVRYSNDAEALTGGERYLRAHRAARGVVAVYDTWTVWKLKSLNTLGKKIGEGNTSGQGSTVESGRHGPHRVRVATRGAGGGVFNPNG